MLLCVGAADMSSLEPICLYESSAEDALERQKASGSYYTPDSVVRSLVAWAVRRPADRLLDPSCGDGRFLSAHSNSVGVEQDPNACRVVHENSPGSLIHQGDFFAWAAATTERFDCAAGNPPFIRFHRFSGEVRAAAQRLCERHGAVFSSLSSSWAPFLVATASLLQPRGRMAFVVPAEIGHAPYAAPLLEYLAKRFSRVHVIAVREKLFPGLSEDCWLLYAEGFGGATQELRFSSIDRFAFCQRPPRQFAPVSLDEWRQWNGRLRPFLISPAARELYLAAKRARRARRLGDVARVGIGYVTGANDFFHLRPSKAADIGIPRRLLHAAVRNGKSLAGGSVDKERVRAWIADDEPVMFLKLAAGTEVPRSVRDYLDSIEGRAARDSYKCRNRDPWYVVPDVSVPDGFLSYMSGDGPRLVSNLAGCVGTNSVHVVHLTGAVTMDQLMRRWSEPLTALSCELEGHPLGGGMLKIEPREASRVLLANGTPASPSECELISEAVLRLKQWRHYV